MKQLLTVVFLAAGLAGCRPEDVVTCTPATPTTAPPTSGLSLAEFTRRNAVPAQSFTLQLGQTQTLLTSGGASLTFPADAFRLPGGGLASGTAQVRVREIYSVADMVLSDMPTTTRSQPSELLISGGEFNIQVAQGTTRLRMQGDSLANTLPPSLLLTSPIPGGQDTTRQRLWSQAATTATNSQPGWAASTGTVQPQGAYYRASIPLDSIGWWNIDQFWHAYAGVGTATVTVRTPLAADTRVYLRPVGYNGLVRLTAASSISTTTGQWQTTVPLGASMKAVVLQAVNGQLYVGSQQFTVQSGGVLAPSLTAVSEAEAVRLIRQL